MKRITLLACLAWLSCAPFVKADERYFVLVFGAQRPIINQAHLSHSWGTFIRVVDVGPYPGNVHIESVTISWLPKTLEIQRVDFPKKGVNLGLLDTLRWSKDTGLRVSLWGPYQIEKSLYFEAVNKATQLASGTVRYQLIDTGQPSHEVCNCIHALGDVPMGSPKARLGVLRGEAASFHLALRLKPWILDAEHTHDWVLSALGLNRHYFIRQYLDECPQ